MIKEDAEEWRQTGTLMSQTPRSTSLIQGGHVLLCLLQSKIVWRAREGKRDKSDCEYIRENRKSKAEGG